MQHATPGTYPYHPSARCVSHSLKGYVRFRTACTYKKKPLMASVDTILLKWSPQQGFWFLLHETWMSCFLPSSTVYHHTSWNCMTNKRSTRMRSQFPTPRSLARHKTKISTASNKVTPWHAIYKVLYKISVSLFPVEVLKIRCKHKKYPRQTNRRTDICSQWGRAGVVQPRLFQNMPSICYIVSLQATTLYEVFTAPPPPSFLAHYARTTRLCS